MRSTSQFLRAGHELILLGRGSGVEVSAKEDEVVATVDHGVDEAKVEDFDALFIPGGYSPDRLRTMESAVRFTHDFVESGKPVFAICHGPQLLISADVLHGRKVTGWKSICKDLENAGAVYEDRRLVRDGNLVSSRMPEDLPSFVNASLRMLKP